MGKIIDGRNKCVDIIAHEIEFFFCGLEVSQDPNFKDMYKFVNVNKFMWGHIYYI
jgi:hypothetical protein